MSIMAANCNYGTGKKKEREEGGEEQNGVWSFLNSFPPSIYDIILYSPRTSTKTGVV